MTSEDQQGEFLEANAAAKHTNIVLFLAYGIFLIKLLVLLYYYWKTTTTVVVVVIVIIIIVM